MGAPKLLYGVCAWAVISVMTSADMSPQIQCRFRDTQIRVLKQSCSSVADSGVNVEIKHKKTSIRWSSGNGHRFLLKPKIPSSGPCYIVERPQTKHTDGRVVCTGFGTNIKYDVRRLTTNKTDNQMRPTTPSTTTTSTCYTWKPLSIVLTPLNDSLQATWSPPIRDYGFQISLYNLVTTRVEQSDDVMSYQTKMNDITSHTFNDVTEGQYEVRLKAIGCSDCPDKLRKCIAVSTSSDSITLDPKGDDERQAGQTGIARVKVLAPQDVTWIYLLAGLMGIAVTLVIVLTAAFCHRDRLCKSNKGRKGQQSKGDSDSVSGRIVILHGVDHHLHIATVMAFANLLRKLLDVEVIVEREQGSAGTSVTSAWLAAAIKPPTTVIVVASEAMYQACSYGNSNCMKAIVNLQSSKVKSKVNCMWGGVEPEQKILLVEFGYGGDSWDKLSRVYDHVFTESLAVTKQNADGTRIENLSTLLQMVAKGVPDVESSGVKLDDFLQKVDMMEEYIKENKTFIWETISNNVYVNNRDSLSEFSRGLDISNDSFSVHSELTSSSNVTFDVLCKTCNSSSSLVLPQCRETRQHSQIFSNTGEENLSSHIEQYRSCVTLNMPDNDSEVQPFLPTYQDDISIVDMEETSSELESDDDSLGSLLDGGRDC